MLHDLPTDSDVLVIGSGPAGSSLAHRLARSGLSVALADRKAFPRRKPCGEFLSPACRPYLADLGVDDALRRAGMREVAGMQLHGFGRVARGEFRVIAPSSCRHGFAIRRELLDQELLSAAAAAGAHLLPRHEFRGVLRAADGRVIGADLRDAVGEVRPWRARFVVGADGVHSPTARTLGLQRRMPWLDRFALAAHFTGVPPQAAAEVHLFPGGNFAATTVDSGLFSLNLLVDRAALQGHVPGQWDDFVADKMAATPALAERLRCARRATPWRGIGPLAHTTARQVGAGFALCGDACGYVDPLTGEGVYFALWGAAALASALHRALAEPRHEAAALHAYERARNKEIKPRLLLSKLLQRGIPHPPIARAVLHILAARPSLADLLVTLTGDDVHPRDLLRPSFWRAFRRARVA
jgi:flavin-dependent dehydrogenase